MAKPVRVRGRPKSFDNRAGQNVIQSLDRALEVLEVLASHIDLTLSEIATEMGQSPATIYRVLTTLELRGIVETNPVTQGWAIGAGAFRLGSAFLRRSNVVERSRPVMRDLMETTGETSNLAIERADTVIFLSQVETHETIRAFFPPGTQAPMHSSGIGKALLSCYSDRRLQNYMRDRTFEGFTKNTITDPDALLAELTRIRNDGYSFDNEEKTEGMRCIASPVFNLYGEAVGGISISGPSNRVTLEDVPRISAMVRAAARNVSRSLGADEPA